MTVTTQGFYNLIIYESDPDDIPHLFEYTHGRDDPQEVMESLEKAISYVITRIKEENYSISDQSQPSNAELVLKVKRLESQRAKLAEMSDEFDEEDYQPIAVASFDIEYNE